MRSTSMRRGTRTGRRRTNTPRPPSAWTVSSRRSWRGSISHRTSSCSRRTTGTRATAGTVDPSAFSPEYVADRRDAVRRFRASNEAALAEWLDGAPANWSRLYARERRAQTARLALGSAVLLAAFALVAWRRGLGAREAAEFV